MAYRIVAVVDERKRSDIVRLNIDSPDEVSAIGIGFYMAVIQDGVETVGDFVRWRAANPVEGVVGWMP